MERGWGVVGSSLELRYVDLVDCVGEPHLGWNVFNFGDELPITRDLIFLIGWRFVVPD